MRAIWAIIPIKDLSRAKQRLSSLLTSDERRNLGLAMLEDVLSAVTGAKSLTGVMLVSADPDACHMAQGFGVRILNDEGSDGLNQAVTSAAQLLAQEGIPRIVVLHGDMPLAKPDEIERLIAALGPAPALSIAPDSARNGSNAMAISPPGVIPFRYGRHSFTAHLQEAARKNIAPKVLDLPGLAFDVDAPEDLFALAAAAGNTRAQVFLRQLPLETRTQTATAGVR